MPVGSLLEGVTGAQNQRFFHVPSNDLESNRKAIGGLAAGQCQRWMPAHIKRRGEAEACLNCGRSTAGDVSQGWRSAVHGGHDEQVDIAEEGIELATNASRRCQILATASPSRARPVSSSPVSTGPYSPARDG